MGKVEALLDFPIVYSGQISNPLAYGTINVMGTAVYQNHIAILLSISRCGGLAAEYKMILMELPSLLVRTLRKRTIKPLSLVATALLKVHKT